ncbi:MAG: biotin--[acetyl-CoA-carboxylase] ligase [Eubacteriales bacterium]|nr:biotin--[acetyl-CoA-carboxylase] ligase [Eubacteriales bacterium]
MKSKILKQLAIAYLSRQDYVSGADMAQDLGVSRTAVSKAVQSLATAGLPIDSVKHHGYRLAFFPDLLMEPLLAAAFARKNWQAITPQAHAFASVDSTNLAARRGADVGDPTGSVYVAEEQTAGRGRRGKNWRSAVGEGLWFSLLLKPDLPPERLAPITLFAGLCTVAALRDWTGLDIQLKWPNDLVILPDGRKVGGILTEMLVEENQVAAVVVGIGINVHTLDFPEDLQAIATSLDLAILSSETAEKGHPLNRIELLMAVLAEWDHRWPQFQAESLESGIDLAKVSWLNDYRAICATLGRPVEVHDANGDIWTGLAEQIAPGGDLLVRRSDGEFIQVSAGDVSVRGLLGYH